MTTPVYSTSANIKALMPDTTWGTKYDTLLTTLIARASRLVDALLHREPGAFSVTDASTRYFHGSGQSKQYIGELAASPSAVRVAETHYLTNNFRTFLVLGVGGQTHFTHYVKDATLNWF